VLDGESVYQYATNGLGIDKDKVHFYGFSLGGAIAAQVKALHPESQGKDVGDRAFKSVFSLITENLCIRGLGPVVKKITALISAGLIAFHIYLLGWEWNGSRVISELAGDKRLIYHPNDCLVPFEASLASECLSDQLIQLDPSNTGFSTHFSPLSRHYTADSKEADSVVVDFLSV
jgi:pimeloyl-ACP methyl ester carboxylesterase